MPFSVPLARLSSIFSILNAAAGNLYLHTFIEVIAAYIICSCLLCLLLQLFLSIPASNQATTSECPDEEVTIHKQVMDEENLVFEDSIFDLITSSLRLGVHGVALPVCSKLTCSLSSDCARIAHFIVTNTTL